MDALRSFVILSEELHFGRAAQRLYMSQPALTKQVKRLEADLGGRLFERTTGHVYLTPAGEALLERARILLADATALQSFARQATSGKIGILRIGFGIATLSDLLPRAVIAYRKAYPHVRLEMQDMGSTQQQTALLDGTIDLGFLRLPITDQKLESTVVLREELLLAVAASRFRKQHVNLKDLRDEPFVLIERLASTTFRQHALNLCAEAGFVPNLVQEAKELFTVLNLIRAGMGVSLVPSTAQRMRVPGVRFFPLKMASAKWDIGMTWRKDRYSIVQSFAKLVLSLQG